LVGASEKAILTASSTPHRRRKHHHLASRLIPDPKILSLNVFIDAQLMQEKILMLRFYAQFSEVFSIAQKAVRRWKKWAFLRLETDGSSFRPRPSFNAAVVGFLHQ
jgi:hypothetical protein